MGKSESGKSVRSTGVDIERQDDGCEVWRREVERIELSAIDVSER